MCFPQGKEEFFSLVFCRRGNSEFMAFFNKSENIRVVFRSNMSTIFKKVPPDQFQANPFSLALGDDKKISTYPFHVDR